MKKLFKIFICLFVLLFICGCQDDTFEVDDEPKVEVDKYSEFAKNITATSMGTFDGEFGNRVSVLKITNNNSEPVMVNVTFEMYNSAKDMIYNKEVYVRVASKKSAYAVARQDDEEEKYVTYKYRFNVIKEELIDYDKIYGNIDISGSISNKNIIVSVTNLSSRTTSIYALVFFYKDNKIVDVKEANEYHLMPTSVRNISVSYPLKSINNYINFDKYSVVLNEVSTEL